MISHTCRFSVLNCYLNRYILLCLLVLLPFPVLSSSNASIINNHFSLSYDELTLPQNEALGLIGGNYLFEINKYFYTGLGIYGAVKGKRGGFFTGGIDAGWRYRFFQNVYVDVNGFVGGGGGGSAPQGGGLMLRGSLEFGLAFREHSFGVGYTTINFPNGNISSRQISLNTRYSFDNFHFSGWQYGRDLDADFQNLFNANVSPQASQFALQLTTYSPRDSQGVGGRQFDPYLHILGVRWRSHIGKNFWFDFETGGAMLGNIDGFAQVFSGLSYENKLRSFGYWNVGVMLGSAGGGNVNSGGGSMYRASLGAGVYLNKAWSLSPQIAWTSAFEGDFKAVTTTMNLVYHYDRLVLARSINLVESVNSSNIFWHKFRIRSGYQRYSHFHGAGRKSGIAHNLDVGLVDLKLDAFIGSNFYVTGQAISAITGKAGGYAVGLVGLGYQMNRYLSAEVLGGVAGGGGIAVGSGQIVQPMVNMTVPVNHQWDIEVSVGYIRAINSTLSSVVSNVGVSYKFRLPALKT